MLRNLRFHSLIALSILLGACGCSQAVEPITGTEITETEVADNSGTEETQDGAKEFARLLSVSVDGDSKEYRFTVEIQSDETGCDQYANWWEILDEDENLIFRRILMHSHVNEQPFSRSGGPVPIEPQSSVIIRVHMHPQGYSLSGFQGDVENGFFPVQLEPGFASHLEKSPPLPDGCAF